MLLKRGGEKENGRSPIFLRGGGKRKATPGSVLRSLPSARGRERKPTQEGGCGIRELSIRVPNGGGAHFKEGKGRPPVFWREGGVETRGAFHQNPGRGETAGGNSPGGGKVVFTAAGSNSREGERHSKKREPMEEIEEEGKGGQTRPKSGAWEGTNG